MALVKFGDLGKAAEKLKTNGQAAATTYAQNAQAAAGDWHANTVAADDNYRNGVTRAANEGRFAKGVQRAGAESYRGSIALVGQNRFSEGIGKAGPSWQKGFGPIASAVAGKDIGPRGITGSAENKQRASNMADAFRAARMAALGVAG